ncbi:MAG: hypothetical protein B6A08_18105 [Sorangiineae bacterium NIC37A_2]|nr:MAG: hypothetical protein B6A08_18105 [Sorangiineae bacterium NIC37A_2]
MTQGEGSSHERRADALLNPGPFGCDMPKDAMEEVGLALLLILALGWGVYRWSRWPRALRVRRAFDADGWRVNAALARHVPAGIHGLHDESYDPSDPDALMDVYSPVKEERLLPAVVWIHGGGWLAGDKGQIENYARILASHGYVVVTVNYSLAPRRKYPTPVFQIARALRYLRENADRFQIDAARFFLAGDSAGAQLAAQLANVISSPKYAALVGVAAPLEREQLGGALLFCGRYDLKRPPYGDLVTTMLWSYSGLRDYRTNRSFSTFSVVDYVSPDFPPTFITCGNGDSLVGQSISFAERLSENSVAVDSLIFPVQHEPALPHEYQFNLDSPEGKQALERAAAFLAEASRAGVSHSKVS